MHTYRVNRYNINSSETPETIQDSHIQGAFRYQKLNLSSPGVLTLENVGVRPTVHTTPITELPGAFNSSDTDLNRIWVAGARTVQMTEIPADTIPDFVTVTPDGTLVDSLAPQVLGSAVAAQLLNYGMEFSVKPLAGGFGFTVLSDTLNSGVYISCDVEAGQVTAHAGSTALDEVVQSAALPSNASVSLDEWHAVHVTVAITDISVSINDVEVIKMTQKARVFGSFGLGASFGHRALFRDLSVSTATGDLVYSHPLTNTTYLADFFMGSNPHATVVDGSRRDRIAYTGDLDIAGGAALASTHGLEFILGSLNLLGSYQALPGFFIPTAKIQQEPLQERIDSAVTGLIGYSFNFLTSVAATYMHTGDVDFAKEWATPVRDMLDWADSQTLPENGLFNVSDASFGGDWNHYDPPQSGVVTKFNVLYAYSLQECIKLLGDAGVDTSVYGERLDALRQAIDKTLWSDELQAYYLSENMKDGYAQDANAIAILAGVNLDLDHSTEAILASLRKLMRPSGPLAFSEVVIGVGWQSYISPYASSYHLRAALQSGDAEGALELLRSLWLPMAEEQNANYTGTFWETLDHDGRPGLGLATSLCHGWAAGPTEGLSRYVLGARPTAPGWSEYQVAPLTLGLRSAQGSLPTTRGNVDVEWSFGCDGLLEMVVDAPAGTKGEVALPSPLMVPVNGTKFMVNGEEQAASTFVVEGGKKMVLTQSRK